MGRTKPDKPNITPTKPTQNETQNITPAHNKTDNKESTKGDMKHSSDHEMDEEPSEDESFEDNALKRVPRKAKKAEEPKNKTAYKLSNLQLEEMKGFLALHEHALLIKQ
jgi:hypothetical protein